MAEVGKLWPAGQMWPAERFLWPAARPHTQRTLLDSFSADRVSLSYLQVASTRLAHDDSRAHNYLIAAIRKPEMLTQR